MNDQIKMWKWLFWLVGMDFVFIVIIHTLCGFVEHVRPRFVLVVVHSWYLLHVYLNTLWHHCNSWFDNRTCIYIARIVVWNRNEIVKQLIFIETRFDANLPNPMSVPSDWPALFILGRLTFSFGQSTGCCCSSTFCIDINIKITIGSCIFIFWCGSLSKFTMFMFSTRFRSICGHFSLEKRLFLFLTQNIQITYSRFEFWFWS